MTIEQMLGKMNAAAIKSAPITKPARHRHGSK